MAPKPVMPMNTPSAAEPAFPAEADRGLDRRRAARSPSTCGAIGRRPAARTAPSRAARRRRSAMPSACQRVARGHREVHLGAGGDQRRLARRRPPRPARSRRGRSGSRRYRCAASAGPAASAPARRARRRGCTASSQHSAVSTASAGRKTSRLRHGAQAGQVLDRLVRRPVLAEADGVVRQHIDHAAARISAARRMRRAQIVGEDQEGAAIGDDAAMQRHAVHRRRPCRARARRSGRSGRRSCPARSPAMPFTLVLFEPVRSAEPPTISGTAGTSASSAIWLATAGGELRLLLGDAWRAARPAPRARSPAARRRWRARTRPAADACASRFSQDRRVPAPRRPAASQRGLDLVRHGERRIVSSPAPPSRAAASAAPSGAAVRPGRAGLGRRAEADDGAAGDQGRLAAARRPGHRARRSAAGSWPSTRRVAQP